MTLNSAAAFNFKFQDPWIYSTSSLCVEGHLLFIEAVKGKIENTAFMQHEMFQMSMGHGNKGDQYFL